MYIEYSRNWGNRENLYFNAVYTFLISTSFFSKEKKSDLYGRISKCFFKSQGGNTWGFETNIQPHVALLFSNVRLARLGVRWPMMREISKPIEDLVRKWLLFYSSCVTEDKSNRSGLNHNGLDLWLNLSIHLYQRRL